MMLESNSLPPPRNARPCIERKQTLDSNFIKHFLHSNQCFASWEDSISPTLPVVTDRVMVFSTASSWHWHASCLLNLVVASFDFENPVEMNVCSRLETEHVVILVCNNTSKTKHKIPIFIVVQPQPSLEPLRLERAFHHRSLPKLPLGEAKTPWLVWLIAYIYMSQDWLEPILRSMNLLNQH